MKIINFFSIVTISLFLCSCQASEKLNSAVKKKLGLNALMPDITTQKESNQIVNKKLDEKIITLQGTIHFFALEGGFYGIIIENGQKILPINLKKKYQINGAIVKVEGQLIPELVTIQQWGTPFKIHKIVVVKITDVDSSLM